MFRHNSQSQSARSTNELRHAHESAFPRIFAALSGFDQALDVQVTVVVAKRVSGFSGKTGVMWT